MNVCLLLSIRPDQGIDFSHVSVIGLLSSLFSLVLVGLDIHSEHQCHVVFCFLHGRLGGEGEFDDGIVVKFVSPRGALLRIFGQPPEPQCFGLDLLCVCVCVCVCGCGCLLTLLFWPSKPLLWLRLHLHEKATVS